MRRHCHDVTALSVRGILEPQRKHARIDMALKRQRQTDRTETGVGRKEEQAEEPKAEEHKAEEPKAEEPKAEEPKEDTKVAVKGVFEDYFGKMPEKMAPAAKHARAKGQYIMQLAIMKFTEADVLQEKAEKAQRAGEQ